MKLDILAIGVHPDDVELSCSGTILNELKLISAIRKYQPEIVLANALDDRHPDHGRAGHLIADASFLSGLIKIETKDEKGKEQDRWRPKYILHYLQDWYHDPDLIIDISDVFHQRMISIQVYASQYFSNGAKDEEPATYISTPDFLESIIGRARMLGKRIGVKYAEGFICEKKIGIRSLDSLLQVET
jgi:bacillithiol biosynthesis deacetylase BshB1